MEMARNRNIQNIIPIGGSGTGGRDRAAKFWEEMNKGIFEGEGNFNFKK